MLHLILSQVQFRLDVAANGFWGGRFQNYVIYSIYVRMSQDKAKDRLEGIVPVVEDWHARMTLMKVRKMDIKTACV